MDKVKAIIYALLAAVFYAINVPVSKVLLNCVGPTTMAALLYLGAGIGIGIMSFFNKKDREQTERLSKSDHCFYQEGDNAGNGLYCSSSFPWICILRTEYFLIYQSSKCIGRSQELRVSGLFCRVSVVDQLCLI